VYRCNILNVYKGTEVLEDIRIEISINRDIRLQFVVII
jgi:hypothetical protein